MLTPSAFEDRRLNQSRLLGLRVAFIVAIGVLSVTFWLLQVVQHSRYEEMAANNHLRTIPLRAPRGVVYDRNGRVLVENRYSFTVAIVREQTRHLDATIDRIAAATGVEAARIREAVDRRRREPLFRPVPVIEHATFAQVAAITARRLELPEVVVQQVPTRTYPEGMAAHLFGYVGEISEAQVAAGLGHPGAIIGQAGIEKIYNPRLMGTDGNRFVVVNSVGREVEEHEREDPVEGERLQLTVDIDIQRALEDGFRTGGFAGAAAILDPKSGELFALTSLPAYDPNAFAVGIENAAWQRLQRDPLTPLNNRLVQGRYSPGSTFKIVMAIAGLEQGVITPETRFFCPGYGTFYGRAFKCHLAGGHGFMDVRHAIEKSCNVFFYNVGDRLKIDTIHQYAAKLGLVGKTGIDLPGEVDSLVPSTEWKRRLFKQPWYPGETISVAIGQGAVSVTPIALATMIATVANGGELVTPHLVGAMDDGKGGGWKSVTPPAPRATVSIKPSNLQAVRDGLWMVVNAQGTGGRARLAGRDVSGKTGTSQVVELRNRGAAGIDTRDHGWFMFFAPRDNPEISGVILAEHGLHGSSAAPIAKHVIETYFAKKENRPLPVWPVPAASPAAQSAEAARPASDAIPAVATR